MQSVRLRVALLCLFAAAPNAACLGDETPSFGIDVIAALSKAGCNSGGCHGNQNGKGGLRLSLRGQDPRADFLTITRGAEGRRVNQVDPAQSLLLQKPSGQLPHLGGRPAPSGSQEFDVLQRWLLAGAHPPGDEPSLVQLVVTPDEIVADAKQDHVPLRVMAKLSNGESRDVTSWAVYETSNLTVDVSPDGVVRRQAFGEGTVIVRYLNRQTAIPVAFLSGSDDDPWPAEPAHNFIDALVHTKLRKLRLQPSSLCRDEQFMRRVYLDVLGVLPPADEARAFVADPRPDKRSRLIDRLLASPEFADMWALRWSDILRNEEKVLDRRGVDAFYAWIHESLQSGKPMDEFVRELVEGRGSTYKKPAANFYRANRSPTVRAEAVARIFLGVRLQCAKCHNHPSDRWTQDDYYEWAALFSRIDYKIVDNKRRDKFDKNEFVGEQVVVIKDKGELKNARTGKDAPPRFLGVSTSDIKPRQDRLKLVARWVASKDNDMFVRAQVNWVWSHLMGRGLVEPIDDFRVTNPPSNPELLDALCDQFVQQRFDLRSLVRTILNSRAYQRSAEPNASNEGDQRNYSRAIVRRLSAEQLLDAQSAALDQPAEFVGYSRGIRAGRLPGVRKFRRREKKPGTGDQFLFTFGKPERLLACECERSNETTLSQALELVGGQSLNDRIQASGNRLERLARSGLTNEQLVDEIYWATLTRAPSKPERTAALAALAADEDRLVGAQDLAWALLNAKEFLFRR